ncbi:hypothetical protein ABT224_20175 [Streptomyces sp. NPDC001584]|uniref:hypothetical protein n=1 Tax=Streptomyces sp. NPDC001584 TaxID=3154521 RepID=UPI003318C928
MTDPTTVTVIELRWAKLVYPPVGDDSTTWVACTTSDGQPAALALDDQDRVALGSQLLHTNREDDAVRDKFFEPGRLYFRGGVTFRCEGLALTPRTTEPRAFGFQHHGRPHASWAPAMLSRRAWKEGWEDITCPAHGIECAPHARVDGCKDDR